MSIAADDPDEAEEAAAQHMTQVHQHEDNPDLREEIRSTMHGRGPQLAAPPGEDSQSFLNL